ncbi:hypothetical protein [Micromonospora sp. RTGN7]|uniref:hypothetical protein n=1 Tax=Micromonospora sp. RTGN7 TaxID=3016526 RepID=UPI0029FEF303|nr:hypothetical protein [Micromonospora sp. RTGN7]
MGRNKELHEYSVRPTVSTPADTFTGDFTVTGGTAMVSRYGYDNRGNQSTLTDAENNVWTSTYNLLGQVVAKSDPDAGSSSMVYDANGKLVQPTDGRNKTLSFTYDALDRKTGEYAATVTNQSSANQRAAWAYDNSNAVAGVTNAIGKLTTTAYRGGQAYSSQQKAFNVFGNSLGQTVTIPATEGALGGSYLNTTTNVIDGNRYYNLPGGGSGIRSGSGTAYTFAGADHQGTPTLYLNNTAQNPTWRQYSPYGTARGTTVATPDNRGFLNKPVSPAGCAIVGARAY